jgi:hypothetical protein
MKTFDQQTISRPLRFVVEKNIWGATMLGIYRYGRRYRFHAYEARRFGINVVNFDTGSLEPTVFRAKLVANRDGKIIVRWTTDSVFLNGFCVCRRGFREATGLKGPKRGARRYSLVLQ